MLIGPKYRTATPLSKMVRRSGMQIEVLILYRQFLKLANQKSSQEKQHSIDYVRSQFKQRADWPARDFETIENWMRKAKKQLEFYQGVQGISFLQPRNSSEK